MRSLLRDLAFHAVGLVTSVLGFTLWVTGVTVSLSLAITVIGLVATLASFYAFRWFARLERQRAALVLGAPIPERYRRAPAGSGWWERLRVAARDPATWKDFAWTFLGSVLSFALSVAAVTLWGVVIGLITLPVWYVYLPDQAAQLGAYTVHTRQATLATAGVGLLLAPVCFLFVRALTLLELAIMVPLLRPSREQELAARVDVLTSTRAGAVDAQASELQRIERDLHDGAQARLVALAMNLGMAEEKLASDPEQARALLAEAATYFVVAEALANAAKHSDGATVLVRLAHRDGVLVAEVVDDGAGGADPAGAGLVGLQRRVEALDGTLRIVSPPGGGTTLRAEIPLGR